VATSVAAGAQTLHHEYEIGDFLRSFILSDEVDHERITARMNHGVLEVVLPKSTRTEARRIPIKSD
jgi:HSP20 family molecular chaperone IbpA